MSIEATMVSLAESNNRLALAVESLAQVLAAGAVKAADQIAPEPEKPKVEKPKAEKKAAPAPEPQVEAAPEVKALTIDEVRAKLTPTIQAHGPDVVKGVLSQMGVNLLSELPADKYADLLTAVEAAVAAKGA